jgi:hypothetical protein
MDGVPDAPWVSRFRESVGPAVNLYYPLAQSVGLSARASARVIPCVNGKHLSHGGCFNLPSSEDLVGFLAKANGHCLRLGLNFGWGVQ